MDPLVWLQVGTGRLQALLGGLLVGVGDRRGVGGARVVPRGLFRWGGAPGWVQGWWWSRWTAVGRWLEWEVGGDRWAQGCGTIFLAATSSSAIAPACGLLPAVDSSAFFTCVVMGNIRPRHTSSVAITARRLC